MELLQKVDTIKGIGPKTTNLFAKLHIFTMKDLLNFYPRTYLHYEDPIVGDDFELGKRIAIKALIQSYVEIKKIRSLTLVSCNAKVGTKSIKLTWFHSPFLKKVFHIGQTFIFVGSINIRNHQLVMEHPEYYTIQQYEKLQSSLQPIYALTEGLSNKTVIKAISEILELVPQLEDAIPEEIRNKYSLLPLKDAVVGAHFPQNMKQLVECRRRLIFDEFFMFLLHMHLLRERMIKAKNQCPINDWSYTKNFIDNLNFSLTKGQVEAIQDIQNDMSGENVMNRLVQGDVGSGKTIIAEIALLVVTKNGYQCAFMAPTEVLAIQHYEEVSKNLSPLGIKVALLCGSTKLSEKRKIYSELQAGDIDIIIGTHALIQEKVKYKKLGLVITDEQHRFGVRQRALLAEKGNEPHVLVMSATPIPRTLGIIMYGDLDISIMKDMPASRKPIKNCVVGTAYRPTAYKFILEQIKKKFQVYIICPMVEASENIEAENVIEYAEQLMDVFPSEVRIEFLHGKMSAEQKNEIMKSFSEQKIDILVSTTVIEVGINNPNATVMMIENAEKFGLAQLHQLRGRVGRGSAQSYCIMISASDKKEALDRLNILNTSNDGFYIANEDLKLRGPGDFFGNRQSGELIFHLGDIYNHADILKDANDAILYLEKKKYPLEKLVNNDIESIQL